MLQLPVSDGALQEKLKRMRAVSRSKMPTPLPTCGIKVESGGEKRLEINLARKRKRVVKIDLPAAD
jgi:hypothetical protein